MPRRSFIPPSGERSRHAMRRRSLAGAVLLAFLVIAVPLARGGVDIWAQASALAVALLALVLATGSMTAVPTVCVALAVVVALIFVQLIPVPPLVHRVSPGAIRVFETSLAPLGLYPAARPLSLDPASTGGELAKAVASIAVLVAAYSLADARRRRAVIIHGLALSGIVVAVAVLGLALAGTGSFVAPQFPFVNRNHLAASLNLSAFVILALALHANGQTRAVWLLGLAITCTASLLTLSRGGLLSLLVGLAVFLVLHLQVRTTPRFHDIRRRLAIAASALLVSVGIAAYVALEPLVEKLRTLGASTTDVRWLLWRPALQVLRDFPLVGVGKGAFSGVFAGYQLESASYQFTHVENEWLQALLDLGVPGGLLLLGAFVCTWIAAARRRDLSYSEIGLLAATAAVAFHNAFDFSLELPGVALPFSIAMGLLARHHRAFALRRPAFLALVAALGLLAAGGVVMTWLHDERVDEARVENAKESAAMIRAARAAAVWHPADWFPHAVAGVRLSTDRRCGEAMPWLLRAMALFPSAPAPHLSAARCLAHRDDRAARREYRLAVLFGSPALAEAAAIYPALGDLFEIAPATPDGTLQLGEVLEPTRPRDALTAYQRALDEFSEDRALLPLARLSDRLGDYENGIRFARRYESAFKADPSGYAAAATSLFHVGRDDDARTEIARGLAAAPGSMLLGRILVARAIEAHRWSEARRLSDEIAPRNPAELAEKLLLAARALAEQGRLAEAIDCAQSATAARPDDPVPLLSLATLCERARRYQDSIDALRRAAALREDPEVRTRIARVEALLVSESARSQPSTMREDAPSSP